MGRRVPDVRPLRLRARVRSTAPVSARSIELPNPITHARAMSPLDHSGLTVSVAAMHVGLLVVFTAVVGIFADSWLALVVGREIAAHGLPSHDALTAATLGRRWVDQQWLGELALFELHRLAGGRLAVVLASLTAVPAVAGALLLGRRRTSDGAVAAAGLLVLVPFLTQASQVRTQSLVYPLFVLLLWLLARPQTRWTRLAAICVLALWANLHGSVLVAAAVTSVRWLPEARAARLRTAFLLVATWLATLASPYALGLPSYYHSTILNPAFAAVINEWRPLTLTAGLLPEWLLLGAVVWAIARSRRKIWSFEPGVLLVLAALTLHSVRTVTFLALAAAAFLPQFLERKPRVARPSSRLGQWVPAAAIAVAALLIVAGVTYPTPSPFDPGAAAVTARLTGSGKAFAPLELGDWLLWHEPGLRGRVSVDARAELLTPDELRRYAALWGEADAWRSAVAGYRTIILSRSAEAAFVRRLLAQPRRFRVAYRDPKLVVFVRRPGR